MIDESYQIMKKLKHLYSEEKELFQNDISNFAQCYKIIIEDSYEDFI